MEDWYQEDLTNNGTTWKEFFDWQWGQGNYACACNRWLFFDEATHDRIDDGSNTCIPFDAYDWIAVTIIDPETGEVMYKDCDNAMEEMRERVKDTIFLGNVVRITQEYSAVRGERGAVIQLAWNAVKVKLYRCGSEVWFQKNFLVKVI